MKMPEKHDLLAAILAAKGQNVVNPYVCNSVHALEYNGGAFTKTVIDATMCAIIA